MKREDYKERKISYTFELDVEADADIIEYLAPATSKQGTIKSALRMAIKDGLAYNPEGNPVTLEKLLMVLEHLEDAVDFAKDSLQNMGYPEGYEDEDE